MSTTSRVAGAVAAGYVLGRFKKLKMAVLVASAMSSPKFRSAAAGMIQDRLPGGTVVNTLTKEVGGKLVDVGKTAATSIVASRIDSLSQSLADRSQNLRKGPSDGQAGKSRAEEPEGGEAEEPEDEYEEQEGGEAEEPEDEYEEQEGGEAEEPADESDEPEGETEEPEDQNAQADDDASRDEEPEEPVARSPRRRRSASPAGRKRG
jgi:cobalamin biosynthesis protein CobT